MLVLEFLQLELWTFICRLKWYWILRTFNILDYESNAALKTLLALLGQQVVFNEIFSADINFLGFLIWCRTTHHQNLDILGLAPVAVLDFDDLHSIIFLGIRVSFGYIGGWWSYCHWENKRAQALDNVQMWLFWSYSHGFLLWFDVCHVSENVCVRWL